MDSTPGRVHSQGAEKRKNLGGIRVPSILPNGEASLVYRSRSPFNSYEHHSDNLPMFHTK